jgi:hypothetical protein
LAKQHSASGEVLVNRIVLAMTMLAMGDVGHAMAQTCGSSAGTGLNITQINNLIANRYACANLSPTEHWNELHTSPYVLDYKQGPTSPTDPSDTVSHPTGTYAVTSPGGFQQPAVVTYTYGSASYGYTVINNLGGAIPWTAPAQYSFCTTGGGLNLAVTIQSTHC